MRRVEQGESFTITRNGRPVADLVPHARPGTDAARTLSEVHDVFRALPSIDRDRWETERAAVDTVLGADEIEQ